MNHNPLTIVVSGPGGVGKGTVVTELVRREMSLWLSKSWTTRAPRPGETDDDYIFVNRKTFLRRVAEGGFYEHAEFLGNFYGTPVPDPPSGCDVVLEIEVQGAAQVLKRNPSALLVLLDAPSRKEQEERLRSRGDDPANVRQRLDKGREEVRIAEELNAVRIINVTVDQTVADLTELIKKTREQRIAEQQQQCQQ